jgi:hypothetical protein
MRVILDDPALLPDLLEFLARMGYASKLLGGSAIEISLPPNRPTDAAALELDVYLATWRALHPDVSVRLG